MTRKELITSRQYWVALLHTELYRVHNYSKDDECEKIAEDVVSDHFMSVINELVFKLANEASEEVIQDIVHIKKKVKEMHESPSLDEYIRWRGKVYQFKGYYGDSISLRDLETNKIVEFDYY